MKAVSLLARLGLTVLMMFAGLSEVAAQPANQTAPEFYMAYRAAFAKAKAIEDVFPYMSKEVKAQVEATPASERPQMFEFVKEMSKMTGVKVIKETKTDKGVTLTVEGVGADKEKMTGQILIVKEGAAWKMGKESWSNKS